MMEYFEDFEEKLKSILPAEKINKTQLKISELKRLGSANNLEITYGAMYECPPLNLKHLNKLSELFGTEEIDVNNYSQCGCETCDWGSDYGNTIQITNITINYKEAEKLFGKGNLYKKGT